MRGAIDDALRMNWEQCGAIDRDPATVSGAWVFHGSRVPVQALFENLDDGATIDEFLQWFPGVTRAQVEDVLRFTSCSLASA